jgi:hypothetical protein
MTMNIPSPSLNDLGEFVRLNASFFDTDEKDCISQYMKNTTEKYSNGKYWLKGQLEKLPDDPIMQRDIDEAIAIDNRRMAEYGGPCNGLEAASIAHHNKKFTNMQKVLEKYYQLMEHEYLRPPEKGVDKGGLYYQQVAENTLIGK